MSRASSTLTRTMRTGVSLALTLVMTTGLTPMSSIAYATTVADDDIQTTQLVSDDSASETSNDKNIVNTDEASKEESAARDNKLATSEDKSKVATDVSAEISSDNSIPEDQTDKEPIADALDRGLRGDSTSKPGKAVSLLDKLAAPLVTPATPPLTVQSSPVGSREGTAYAVLDSAGVMTFFRSIDTYTYTPAISKTVTDIMGNTYTGHVFSKVENTSTYYKDVPWYSWRADIKLAKIAEGQVIAPKSCAGWFFYSTRMTAFEGAERLDTSATTSMERMFEHCSAMTETPSVASWDTSKVTSMLYMFSNCSKIVDPPSVSNWDTSNVTDMGSMFNSCSAMASPPVVDSWDTHAVTYMWGMFRDCSAITEPPAVGNWNTSLVASMGSMFSYCEGMTAAPSVGNWDTSKVTDITEMFRDCSAMTSPPAVGNWNTSAVTKMYWMFYNCSSMTEPPAVGSWDTSKVNKMDLIFLNCSKMASPPSVGNWDTSAVTNMERIFGNCSSMTEPPAVGSWDTSKVTNMSGVFAGCNSITEPPAVGNWDTSNATNMSGIFSGCSAMAGTPAVGSWSTSEATNMSSMFYSCSKMAEPPAVGNWDTSKTTDMRYMFNNCYKMSSLDISSWDFSNITSSSNYLGLGSCLELKELKIPAGAKITSLSEHRAQDKYLATWGNAGQGVTGLTAAELVSAVNAGNGVGTWTWDLAGYNVDFMVDGSGTAMQGEFVKTGDDYIVSSCKVAKLYHDFVEWSGSDGKIYQEGDTIPAGAFNTGERLTLTAMFEPHEYGPGESDDNLQITVPTSINLVARADGTLIGPSNAAIENHSTVGVHISSVDVDEQAPFKIVADAAASSSSNSIDIQFGPATDQLNAASYLAKTDVTDPSRWSMTAEGSSAASLGLQVGGHISNITEDITAQSKFGTIKWYLKVAT